MDTKSVLDLEGAILVSTFYQSYRKKVFLYLMHNIKNKTVSEDVTSAVFFKIAKAIAKGAYKDRNNPSSWIMQIAHNEMVNYFRVAHKISKVTTSQLASITESSLNSLATLERFELHDEVRSLLDKLPKGQKEIVVLRVYEEIPFKEIADMRGVTNGTLRGQYHKALVNLRRLMREKGLKPG